MTHTKKVRLLEEYISKGLGEQVVLILKDLWSFDPEVFPRYQKIREQYTVADALEQFKEKKGYVYLGINMHDLIKVIEKNNPIVKIVEYQDTKEEFFEKYPNFYQEERVRYNNLIANKGNKNKYKSTFMS